MVNAPSVKIVASDAAPNSAKDIGAADFLPYSTEPGSDAARISGLLATVQIEAVPGNERKSECRDLSYCHRH